MVFYPFTEGSGLMPADQSNNGAPMALVFTGSVSWNPSENGVVMSGGRVATAGNPKEILLGLARSSHTTLQDARQVSA